MRTATCHTEGCGNQGHPIEVVTDYEDPDTGEVRTVGGVSCGVCGQPIEDVEPPLTEPLPDGGVTPRE